MSAPVPYSPVDRKTSAEHEQLDPQPLIRSLLFWLMALAGAGVVVVTGLSARALGTHAGRHAYPHVLADSSTLSRAADASSSMAVLPLHDIDRHFSALVGLSGNMGVPVAIPLMAGGVIVLALAIYLIYRPRRYRAAPRPEISVTSRRRRARKP